MSAIAAWASARREPNRDLLAAMLTVMQNRGTERAHLRVNQGGALAVGRFAWECSEGFAGTETVYQDNGILVAADATLYYRDDLVRALGNEKPRGGSASHLIAAAYRKWGADVARHLEGDFAVVIWDAGQRRLVTFRDFAGSRPLYYAVNADRIALASVASALLQDPTVSEKLDVSVLAAEAAGFLGSAGPGTGYRDIKVLPAAHTLVWTPDGGPKLHAHWEPPRWSRGSHTPFEHAAEELRDLLTAAARERLSPHGVTCISLSGGWDSPAVFGAAQEVLRRSEVPGQILPVSMSYPEGDPGREDEFIQQIADRWNVPVRWVQAYDVPILDRDEAVAADRDLAWTHMYERWNRRLAEEARSLDARVLLSGYGGDQLFQVSTIYLADLLRTFRWGALRRELRAQRARHKIRHFFRWAVKPNLGPFAREIIRLLRGGRRVPGYIDRELPAWFRSDFAEQERLVEQERRHLPTRKLRSRAEAEAHWYLTEPFFPRVNMLVAEYALESGVELRSPLYDCRIVTFAASRPWSDRAQGPETKRLLRASVRGLVPDEVLAPRKHRTGITGGYAVQSAAQTFPPLVDEIFQEPLRLADLGIIEPSAFREACDRMLRDRESGLELPIFLTLHVELWLRSRTGDRSEPEHEESASATPKPGAIRV